MQFYNSVASGYISGQQPVGLRYQAEFDDIGIITRSHSGMPITVTARSGSGIIASRRDVPVETFAPHNWTESTRATATSCAAPLAGPNER
jgi:hypothetical protein